MLASTQGAMADQTLGLIRVSTRGLMQEAMQDLMQARMAASTAESSA